MSHPDTRTRLDARTRTEAVTLLLAAATTSHERNAITRAALRAKFLWRCHPCKTDYPLTRDCACGARRPLGGLDQG